MRKVATIVSLVLVSLSANADCESSADEYRMCFDNNNAPPEWVFRMLLSSVFRQSADFLGDLSQIDGPRHAGWHTVKDGVTPKMSSADAVRYFVAKFVEIEEEVHDVQNEMLCTDGVPRYRGAENFELFNQLDDILLNVYKKHYYLVRADLQVSGLYNFDRVIEDPPIGFTAMFENHSLALWKSEDRIYEAAEAQCASQWSISINQ